MGFFKANAKIFVTVNGIFTGERDEFCQPIFTTQTVEVPLWLELDSDPQGESLGVNLTEVKVRGRFIGNPPVLNQSTYKCAIETDITKEILGDLYIEVEPRSVMGMEQYFGVKLSGTFRRSK